MTIIYIHGFASNGDSSKGRLLKEHFDNVLTPTLSHNPDEAIKQVHALITSVKYPVLVGSSLGGFYARYFHAAHNIPVLLINPLMDPDDIRPVIGLNQNLNTGETFEFTEEHLAYLKELHCTITDDSPESRFDRFFKIEFKRDAEQYVILAADDEVLDYRKALGLPNVTVTTGGHRMTDAALLISQTQKLMDSVKARSLRFTRFGKMELGELINTYLESIPNLNAILTNPDAIPSFIKQLEPVNKVCFDLGNTPESNAVLLGTFKYEGENSQLKLNFANIHRYAKTLISALIEKEHPYSLIMFSYAFLFPVIWMYSLSKAAYLLNKNRSSIDTQLSDDDFIHFCARADVGNSIYGSAFIFMDDHLDIDGLSKKLFDTAKQYYIAGDGQDDFPYAHDTFDLYDDICELHFNSFSIHKIVDEDHGAYQEYMHCWPATNEKGG